MKNTKKWIAAFLAIVMTFALVACGAPTSPEDGGMLGGNSAGSDNYVDEPTGSAPEETLPEDDQGSVGGFVENPFIATEENNVSTFSADVDTASYSYFRKLVNRGYTLSQLKSNGASFRTEEFINYFKYDLPAPAGHSLFGVQADVFSTPWSVSTVLLRLSLQAETAISTEGNNLVFLIDVSGSMNSPDKLPLLKRGFSTLTQNLTADDTVSIVTYSGREQVVLDGCRGNETDRILNAIDSLSAYGSTNGEAGLNRAYEIAQKHRILGGNNRIIMASDGDLNVGISSEAALKNFVSQKRESGIYLSVLGFGTGNYRDAKMETLADNGNGVYYYIDGETEVEKVMGSDLLGTLYTVAEDVKLQITFDQTKIASYRLIGYENRLLNEEDFEDDTKDAGEVGAGHAVTVFYELTLAEGALATNESWMKLAVRYKNPGEATSLLNEYSIGTEDLVLALDDDLQFMVCVIQTTMILHNSKYAKDATVEGIVETLEAMDLSRYPDRAEFLTLLKKISD